MEVIMICQISRDCLAIYQSASAGPARSASLSSRHPSLPLRITAHCHCVSRHTATARHVTLELFIIIAMRGYAFKWGTTQLPGSDRPRWVRVDWPACPIDTVGRVSTARQPLLRSGAALVETTSAVVGVFGRQPPARAAPGGARIDR